MKDVERFAAKPPSSKGMKCPVTRFNRQQECLIDHPNRLFKVGSGSEVDCCGVGKYVRYKKSEQSLDGRPDAASAGT